MAKIQKTDIDKATLEPDKYILSGFTLHTGEFETERYFEELDLESEARRPSGLEINPVLSMSRLLNSVKEPDKMRAGDED